MSTLSVQTITDVRSFDFGNTQFSGAYNASNAAFASANASYAAQNVVFAVANASYASVNSNWTVTNTVYGVANAAFASANNVAPQVTPAFNTANGAFNTANAAFASANNVGPQLAPAFNTANAAFGKANTALQNTSGTFAGDLTATLSLRAPIFYDSNNIAYYVDPASTSNLNGLTVAGTITGSVSGNAGTATSSPLLSALGNYVWNASSGPTSFNQGIQSSFVSASQGFQSFGSVMTMNTYAGGGGALQLYVPYSPTYGGTSLQVRFGNYDAGGNSWTSWKTLLDGGNSPWVLVGTVTATNAGAIQDTSILSTAGYTRFMLIIKDTYTITNATTLHMQFYSGGAYQGASYTAEGTVLTSGGYTGMYLASALYLSYPSQSSSVHPCFARIEILNPSNTTYWKPYFGQGTYYSPSNAQSQTYHYGGAWQGGVGAITGFRIYAAAGNVTGTVHVYGGV